MMDSAVSLYRSEVLQSKVWEQRRQYQPNRRNRWFPRTHRIWQRPEWGRTQYLWTNERIRIIIKLWDADGCCGGTMANTWRWRGTALRRDSWVCWNRWLRGNWRWMREWSYPPYYESPRWRKLKLPIRSYWKLQCPREKNNILSW